MKLFKRKSKDDRIFSLICRQIKKRYGVSFKKIASRTRKQNIREKRQMLHDLACDLTGLAKTEIGRRTNRTHASVIHSQEAIRNAIITDKRFAEEYNDFRLEIINKIK